jgi:hypothetical protein
LCQAILADLQLLGTNIQLIVVPLGVIVKIVVERVHHYQLATFLPMEQLPSLMELNTAYKFGR